MKFPKEAVLPDLINAKFKSPLAFPVCFPFIFHRRHLSDKIVADTHSYAIWVELLLKLYLTSKCCLKVGEVKSFSES